MNRGPLPLVRRIRPLVALAALLFGAALADAQQIMEFERISPESARALERERRAGRTRPMPPVPPAPGRAEATPDEPLPPEPITGEPITPEPPRIDRTGDITRFGSDVHIEKDEVVDGDVFALGGDIRVDGHVKGNVATTGGDVTLGATAQVDGDVMCIGGELVEEPGAQVRGQRVTAARGEHLPRRVARKLRARGVDWEEHGTGSEEKVAASMAWIIILLGAAWAATKLAPGRTAVAVDTLRRETGMSFVVGLIVVLLLVPSLIAMALVVAILCITIIGIPLAIGVLFGYFILLFILCMWGLVIGLIPVGQAAAQRFRAAVPNLTRAAFYGVLAVGGLKLVAAILRFMPLMGGLATLLAVISMLVTLAMGLIGMGALIRSKIGQGPEGAWWPLVRKPSPLEPVVPVPAAPTAASAIVSAPPPPPPPPSPPTAFQPPPAPEPPPPTG